MSEDLVSKLEPYIKADGFTEQGAWLRQSADCGPSVIPSSRTARPPQR